MVEFLIIGYLILEELAGHFNEARQQYYYHSFNQNQPDINWRNPEVKAAIFK